MTCGGIFSKYFAANLLENLTVKNLENRLRINKSYHHVFGVSLFWNTGIFCIVTSKKVGCVVLL